MKKLGLFLLKNNIHIMTLIFLGWAVWCVLPSFSVLFRPSFPDAVPGEYSMKNSLRIKQGSAQNCVDR